MTEAFYLLVDYKTQERTYKVKRGDGKEKLSKNREKRQGVGDETVLIQDGESRTTRKFYAGVNCYNYGKKGHYADDCDKSDRRSDNNNIEEGAEVQMLNHDSESDNEGFDFSFINICDSRNEDFESDDDKDLTLQGYSYVHNLPPVYDPSPDDTNYNDDETDNTLYPYQYIEYPEDKAVAELASDKENCDSGSENSE